ncbi:HAMP domain-containing sensor histidine kinase [Hymenobacter sp. GOD-10R]|uniref:sensor histidine kinase n=1 Tax=Hymenobacter sp. GOD-10R TaxID=3093922 RepID=UPI002D767941|nr:HAMP domain-containing sensor histidine kinase [Hymenobacter sp. GOD-10R]WRQ30401.1 HAMP domain-containing sensor histidine kinase [Hymenobacter sp. GOD-10R]
MMARLQIKHKLLLWFSSLVGLILLAFSTYVYLNYVDYRHDSFVRRLTRKAKVAPEAFYESGMSPVLASLPEQAEYLYAPDNTPLYASLHGQDFQATPEMLAHARREKEHAFAFRSSGHRFPKDGVAVVYHMPNKPGDYVSIVTAYDNAGYSRQHDLLRSLLYGNLMAVVLVGGLGLLFASRALAPLNFLIRQLRAPGAQTRDFRLRALNSHDEVGVLAAAFNDLLARQEALSESQQAFIAQASHELRTPLTTIKGWLETSLDYDSDVASLKEGISQAAQELDKLTALTNGLLHLARLGGFSGPLERQPLELMDVLLDVIDTVQRQHPGQRLSLAVSEGVERQLTAPVVLGNAHLLRTALVNLVDNACKYSAGQPVALCLEMNTDEGVRLRIEDRGIGIASADIERIFQPLIRGSNVQNINGFGIGLTLAGQILQLHQAQLRLHPRAGGGTVAEVDLPLVKSV